MNLDTFDLIERAFEGRRDRCGVRTAHPHAAILARAGITHVESQRSAIVRQRKRCQSTRCATIALYMVKRTTTDFTT